MSKQTLKYEELTPLQKRLYDGAQRMRDRAIFVMRDANGNEELFSYIPDDDLEDALREAMGLPR